MKNKTRGFGILLVGAGPRLMAAALIVLALWAGFFWATGLPLPLFGAP